MAIVVAIVEVVLPDRNLSAERFDFPFHGLESHLGGGGQCPPEDFVHHVRKCEDGGDTGDCNRANAYEQDERFYVEVTHSLYDNFLASSCEA